MMNRFLFVLSITLAMVTGFGIGGAVYNKPVVTQPNNIQPTKIPGKLVTDVKPFYICASKIVYDEQTLKRFNDEHYFPPSVDHLWSICGEAEDLSRTESLARSQADNNPLELVYILVPIKQIKVETGVYDIQRYKR